MRQLVAVVLCGLVLVTLACHSADTDGKAAANQDARDSSFRNLGKRDSSPVSPWDEGVASSR